MTAPGVVNQTENKKLREGAKIPLVATSRVPNAVTSRYTARAVLILGGSWVNIGAYTFLVSAPTFTKFCFLNVEGAVVNHLFFRFTRSLSVLEIFAIKV